MANSFATHSVGASLVNSLKSAFAAQREIRQGFEFRLVSAGELADSTEPFRNRLTLFLYRITPAAEARNPNPPDRPANGPPALALELHYLMTAWADDARMEQSVLTWAMREMQLRPVLDGASLTAEAQWAASDVVQIIPAELSVEEMARIWDGLSPKYRLSTAYVARVVPVDTVG